MKEEKKEKKGSSLLETRRRNRVYIKDTIFKMEPVTRSVIAEGLGLTLPTITTSINEMIEEGILEEIPLPADKMVNNAGRKPNAIGFAANAAHAVGVELGPYATRAVVMNMKGQILGSSEEKAGDESYETMLQKLAEQIQALIGQTEVKRPLGVGVGLPGFIESAKGLIRSNPRPHWTGRYLADDLERMLGLPVMIDNNVRLRAVGYEMQLHGQRPDSFAYFYISRGIACPLLVKDDVLSGYTAGAGEIGHMVLHIEETEGCQGHYILDELAGETAIFAACRKEMEAGGAKLLERRIADAGELTMKQVLEAQREGDPAVCRILEKGMEYLGIALANVVNLVNPGFVVVDGYIMSNQVNARRLEASAKANFFGLNEEEVNILFTEFDHYNGAKGAAYFILRKLLLEK